MKVKHTFAVSSYMASHNSAQLHTL